ncbi:VrrA/YqfQ family protein [Jeotgalibacillus sp. ET6]|uniref:VrrA/YqfQ family protein n=1 Tax=Jeotgalibacillus sp. ET6 TaxID=3037260 RepID=UPI002418456A|nr:VrrA/YqfQ family protein [Jeotgalibacillus sp. ET6]MDG5470832.1 VrrA/YqfQ family protein [Jeotgalibacillus sp. ET6]
MNRRQKISNTGFQLPAGLRSQHQPFNSNYSRQSGFPFGGISPFTQGQQPAQKRGLFSAFGRQKQQSQGGLRNLFQGAGNSSPNPITPFYSGSNAPESSSRGIASLLSGGSGSGSGATSAFSMASIQKWVGSTQQMIQTAQQALPMIQQYGPLVRNFPAMWKLYRSLNSEDKENDTDLSTDVEKEDSLLLIEKDEKLSLEPAVDKPVPAKPKTSVPKLYV